MQDQCTPSPGMKACTKCGKIRPATVAEFGRTALGRDGLRSQCKSCQHAQHAVWARKARAANPDLVARKQADYYAANRERALVNATKRTRAWKAANLEKQRFMHRAHVAVEIAIRRGILIRPTLCEACGKSGKPDAAHSDYSRPLDVRWLCRSCHVRWDHEAPKLRK